MPFPITKMPSLSSSLTAGGRAIFNLPIGLAYRRLFLRYTENSGGGGAIDATAAKFTSDFSAVRVVIDGETKWDVSGGFLVKRNAYYKETAYDGVLPLIFSPVWAASIQGEDLYALGTSDVKTLTVEVDVASGTTPTTLELYAEQAPAQPLGAHLCIRRFTKTISATGTPDIADIPTGPYSVAAIHIDTANISDLQVLADQRKVHESDAATRKALYGQRRTPQSSYTHIDFAHNNRVVAEPLPLVLQDFRLKPTFTSTGTINMFVERVESRAATAKASG